MLRLGLYVYFEVCFEALENVEIVHLTKLVFTLTKYEQNYKFKNNA